MFTLPSRVYKKKKKKEHVEVDSCSLNPCWSKGRLHMQALWKTCLCTDSNSSLSFFTLLKHGFFPYRSSKIIAKPTGLLKAPSYYTFQQRSGMIDYAIFLNTISSLGFGVIIHRIHITHKTRVHQLFMWSVRLPVTCRLLVRFGGSQKFYADVQLWGEVVACDPCFVQLYKGPERKAHLLLTKVSWKPRAWCL